MSREPNPEQVEGLTLLKTATPPHRRQRSHLHVGSAIRGPLSQDHRDRSANVTGVQGGRRPQEILAVLIFRHLLLDPVHGFSKGHLFVAGRANPHRTRSRVGVWGRRAAGGQPSSAWAGSTTSESWPGTKDLVPALFSAPAAPDELVPELFPTAPQPCCRGPIAEKGFPARSCGFQDAGPAGADVDHPGRRRTVGTYQSGSSRSRAASHPKLRKGQTG